MISVLLPFVLIICLFYCGYAWNVKRSLSFGRKRSTSKTHNTPVTVVVAFRNEALRLPDLIRSILSQQYDGPIELILCDDHSTDESCSIIKKFQNLDGRIKLLHADHPGKKAALLKAIGEAKSELIFQTDADCIAPDKWIKTMVSEYGKSPKMLAGPVRMASSDLFSSLQAIEMAGLVGVTASSIEKSRPFLCNGANLVFSRTAFIELNGYEGYMEVPGGDDVFLMKKFFEGGFQVQFCGLSDAVVTTGTASNLSSLIGQKVRWISKVDKMNNGANAAGILILTMNLLLLLLGGLSIFSGKLGLVFILVLFFKSAADAMILFPTFSLLNQRSTLKYLPVFEVAYPFYLIAIALGLSSRKYSWKGREVRI